MPMRVLVADDDSVSRRMLDASLSRWGYEVVSACDGIEAWEVMQREHAPPLAVLDWVMPGIDGVQVCRNARANPATESAYVILLSSRSTKANIIEGLDAGADDYLAKPFDREELQARIRVGVRTIELRQRLAEQIRQYEEAQSQIRVLQDILPICSYCKNIRSGEEYWEQVEAYISQHSGAQLSHSICPDCYEKIVKPQIEQLQQAQVRG